MVTVKPKHLVKRKTGKLQSFKGVQFLEMGYALNKLHRWLMEFIINAPMVWWWNDKEKSNHLSDVFRKVKSFKIVYFPLNISKFQLIGQGIIMNLK